MPKYFRPFLKLCLPLGMTTLAFLVGPAVPEAAAACPTRYGYFDDIYTDPGKTEWCGSYNSCTDTHYGCLSGYRQTEIIICGCYGGGL